MLNPRTPQAGTILTPVADLPAPAVRVDGLSKSFRVPHEQTHTLKERVLHPFRGTAHERFEALKGASFEVNEGEFFGIVGRNGSGKSTLLKCLSGIYRADGGDAWIRGHLSTFIELGVGFNMDLPARDNIRLNAVMLGITTADAREREERILEFAGLENFRDLKIKNYSSGMLVRLGFAIMIHVDADVLLIDEVLAVGDAEFQQKCYEQFDRIRAEGRTVLLVTHDMAAVQRYCDRAVLLEHGEVVALGEPAEVAREYLRLNFKGRNLASAREVPGLSRDEDPKRTGDGGAEIIDAWFEEPPDWKPTSTLPYGGLCRMSARVRFNDDVWNPVFGVVLGDERYATILSLSSARTEEWTGLFHAGEEVVFWIEFTMPLDAGRYEATPSVARHGLGNAFLDRREGYAEVLVTNPGAGPGIVAVEHGFSYAHAKVAPARQELIDRAALEERSAT